MSTGAARAWVLNLDAEAELEDPKGYTRGRGTEAQLRRALDTLRRLRLLGPKDVILDPPGVDPSAARGLPGACWCPTPRARERLLAAGARPGPAPPLDLLRRVNDRRFAVEVDPGPLQTRYVSDIDALEATLRDGAPPWVLKRALSFAGRGHRRVLTPFDDADRRWCANSFRRGLGLAIEAWVERRGDFAQHGWVDDAGRVTLGRPVQQHCDAHGAWRGAEPDPGPTAGGLTPTERSALGAAAERAGRELGRAGYWGPFGIDAFRFRTPEGDGFNPMCELNARYSMAWGLCGLSPHP